MSSQKDPVPANGGITGLIALDDGGGESQAAATGGFRMAGTGVGPIVYSSGVIKQYIGGGQYSTLVPSAGTGIRSMTVTGLGLLVADVDTLKLRSGTGLTPALPAGNPTLPGGKLPAGDQWVSITTLPNGHVLGWAYNSGWGALYDINLSSGQISAQDWTGQGANNPFLNNRNAAGVQAFSAPVFNSGGISADGQGGVWVASAGIAGPGQPSSGNQVYYAAPNGSFSSVASGYTNPQIASTGTGEAYVTNTDGSASPFFADVFKVTPSGGETQVTSSGGDLTNSRIDSIVVDRCYTSCSVTGPGNLGGGGGGAANGGTTGKTSSPLTATPSTASVTKKGLGVKLKCAVACSVSISGSLAYGKASGAASAKLATTKANLKAGKSTTVVIKLSKGQRKAIKKAKRKKRKVTAKLKVKVTPKGGKATTKPLKLRVK